MKRKSIFLLIAILFSILHVRCGEGAQYPNTETGNFVGGHPETDTVSFPGANNRDVSIHFINPTFLNNRKRNYYGDSLPSRLRLLWKTYLGHGKTGAGKDSLATWAGAGWTGQPLMVLENGKKYIIQGAYDHHLKKIDAETGSLIWQYQFDDVLKGTGTLWFNAYARRPEERVLILQGSRASFYRALEDAPSYRAVSYFSGKEMWRLPSRRTLSYSRDNDASALIIRDTAYIGFENGVFNIFNPDPAKAVRAGNEYRPLVYRDLDTLYYPRDTLRNGHNLVTEASPAFTNNHVYLASGSGKIFGYNLAEKGIDWVYVTGSDIDGSPVVTSDSCLLISVEKQFIKGPGGLLKLDPRKAPSEALVWFYPTANKGFASWQGGIIGTAAVNDAYRDASTPSLAVCTAIDGYLSVVMTNEIDESKKVLSFDGKNLVPTPKVVFRHSMGQSISSPIFVGNRIAALGYKGFFLFEHDKDLRFKRIATYPIYGEATPFADNGRVYVASRDGYLYCFGER